MPNYTRAFVPGGTFFFTLVAEWRRVILTTEPMRDALHHAFDITRRERTFVVNAIVLLPDHLHCIMTMPEGDADFSTRWRLIKTRATRAYLRSGGREAGRSESRQNKSERGVWQRRLWEHQVRDESAYIKLCDYIHYNPVRHEHARCPHQWAYSSFAKFVREKLYEPDWGCVCKVALKPPEFDAVADWVGE